MALTTLLCAAALTASALGWTTPPTATVLNGTYQGVNADTFNQQFFLGMPFAQQPVGDLRLRAPLSLNTSWTGTRDASNYSAICPGFPTSAGGPNDDTGYELSEACLTINVIRPNTVTDSSSTAVLAYIYGGGYSMGGSADHRYNGSWIVQRSMEMGTPIIFASFNYRVTAFGFLGGQEVHDAGLENLGLLDQRLALHWLQENIAAFGGDPTKVTIFGESAGAMSIANHLTAYGGRDDKLFRAAGMESGSPTTENYPSIAQLEPMYQGILSRAGCANATDGLSCLRGVSYDTFRMATNGTGPWQPVIDGNYIPYSPTELLKEGKLVKVPLLIGANTDEGTSFTLGKGINTTEQLAAGLLKGYPMLSNASIAQIINLYPNVPAEGCPYNTGDGLLPTGYLDKVAASIGGDIVMVGPRRFLAQMASYYAPVYSYRFNQLPINYTMESGVGHFSEVCYVFSNPQMTQNPLGNRPRDITLANLMTSMWVSFAHGLDPNNNFVAGAPYWPSYADGPKNMVFQLTGLGASSFVEDDTWRSEGIAFINTLGPELQH
ncbi:carboxylesterase family protein [Calocera cornea HHB12733]|uniref:Carboxylic ester hydrolase n=1 Tax=Calocera cornea HHB12733 TaxID=1353952 RepID=A0A165EUP2_9BASI|nr:carboxylesterase family protein [Calocera cornea HHB12733]